jgi:undecaprenyl-diphosphatase
MVAFGITAKHPPALDSVILLFYPVLMTILEAVLLGAVQGLTEFLPVSSSGHLVLVQELLHISEPALFFDTMVHTGTLFAVVAVLWPDIWLLIRRPIQPMTSFLIIATLPAVIVALVFKDGIEAAFSSTQFLGIAFLITAAVLFISEVFSKRPGTPYGVRYMQWYDALIIGIMQGIAIVPGISRSGFTLSSALARKLDRESAARFSFLLSIPAILGAVVLQVKDGVSDLVSPAPIIAGTLTAAIVGFFSIKFMLRIVRERSLLIFACYTAALGAAVLIWL